MSAKDIAFEKERVKYRRLIREAEIHASELTKEKHELQIKLNQSDDKVRVLEEWVERLCEHIDITREEFLKSMEVKQSVSNLFGVIGAIGGGYRW